MVSPADCHECADRGTLDCHMHGEHTMYARGFTKADLVGVVTFFVLAALVTAAAIILKAR